MSSDPFSAPFPMLHPPERTIWICRHGHRADADPLWKQTADRPYDPPLSEHGRAQAQRLGKHLATRSIAHVVASPFLRTVETAALAAEALGLGVKVEPGLAEWLRDIWFAAAQLPLWLPTEPLHARFPSVDLSHTPIAHPTYPEPHPEMLARTARTTQALLARYPGDLLLIGHGASVNGASRGVLGTLSPVGIDKTPLCGLVRITRRRGIWGIEATGADTSHLGDLCIDG